MAFPVKKPKNKKMAPSAMKPAKSAGGCGGMHVTMPK